MPSFRVTTIVFVFFAFICMLYCALSSIRSLKIFFAFSCVRITLKEKTGRRKSCNYMATPTCRPPQSLCIMHADPHNMLSRKHLIMLPGENCNDCGVSRDADYADQGNVHAETVNKPVRRGVNDVTIAQPMTVQIRSAVIMTLSPHDHASRRDWLVGGDDIRNVG